MSAFFNEEMVQDRSGSGWKMMILCRAPFAHSMVRID